MENQDIAFAFADDNKFTGEGVEKIFIGSESHNSTNFIKARTLFICAIDDEARRISKAFNLTHHPKFTGLYVGENVACVETGMGGKFVVDALSKLEVCECVQVVNIGYCGSNHLKKGELVEISKNVKIGDASKTRVLSENGVLCYSSDVFVQGTEIKEACAFDMELSYICDFFPSVISYKIVSDNLDEKEFANFVGEKVFNPDSAWLEFSKTIKSRLSY